jgi:hypothetical protein
LARGISTRDDVVQSWSGAHVLAYFKDGDPTADAVLKCSSFAIPLS